ncbi:MAG: M3 family oligoendopeptidase [Fervidobacterium sp.]
MEWDLQAIFASDETALQHANNCVEILAEYIDILEQTNDFDTIVSLISKIEDVLDEFGKAAHYAWMRYSINTDNQDSQKLLGYIQNLESKVSEYFARLEVHISQFDNSIIDILKEKSPNYTHFFEMIKLRKKHILSKDAERILALTSVSRRGAISKIHSRLESSYRFTVEIDGQVKTLTTEEIKALRRSSNGELRKKAMNIFLERFREDSLVLTEIYNLIVKDYDTEAKIRNFKSPISMMNLENEVEDDVVEKLIETTNRNINILQEYYSWKSKTMGERLTLADIYAPINQNESKFTFNQAKEIVIDAYYSFNKQVGDIVKSFFDESRIDAFPRRGKVGGAYCIYATTKLPPYVLTNFNGDMYDVMTLAHELGHGLHGTLSKKQTYFNYNTPLTLAELASVFGEFLVFDYLKDKLDRDEKLSLMTSKVEDTFATTFRQNMFTNFEIRAHNLISSSGYADWDELNEIYYQELKKTFGDVVEIPEWYKSEWAIVSHIFETPFYVYAYNFAHCLVISLYEKYLEDGKVFVSKYLNLLESGGSLSPHELLLKVGVDISEAGFWDNAFKFMKVLVNDIKELRNMS